MMRDPESGAEGPTDLHRMLLERGARSIVVVGLALDYCVRATALDAIEHGYSVAMPLAATAAVDLEAGDGAAAAAEVAAAGATVV
jgi:nicotinamidase/pyrazinamidase